MSKSGSVLGGVLLVAGTTIGGGILALPLSASFAGIWPAVVLLVAGWCYMTYTALLTLEVNLWVKDDSNFTTMIHKTLGVPMALVAGILYAFLLLCLLTAYMSNIGHLVIEAFDLPANVLHSSWAVTLPLTVILAIFICMGTRVIDYANRVFMTILVISFALLISLLPSHINPTNYFHNDWSGTLVALAMVVLSYGYHIIIPSLVTYLDGDESRIRRSLLLGSLVPLCFYLLWVVLVFGVLPATGEWGLTQVWHQGGLIVSSLKRLIDSPLLILGGEFFTLAVVLTSLIGVVLSLFDFLADTFHDVFGVQPKKSIRGKFFLAVLTFVPPLLLAMFYKRALIQALDYAGTYGVVTLLGIFPALMAWRGRYVLGFTGSSRVPGGRIALLAVIVFSLVVMVVGTLQLTGNLSCITDKYFT